ncbi:MAG: META domain-containing protein [Mycobacterium sp.]
MLRSVSWLSVAVSALAVAGCAGQDEPRTLEGTSWRLVQIESMDDAQGATPIPDPGAVTVSFGEDGTAAFQLDCNSGSGSFDAEPTGDGATGSLTFGPIATTLMGCPEPSLDQDVGAALPHVRGYVFRDDQLHMSLMADGGILSWAPLTG